MSAAWSGVTWACAGVMRIATASDAVPMTKKPRRTRGNLFSILKISSQVDEHGGWIVPAVGKNFNAANEHTEAEDARSLADTRSALVGFGQGMLLSLGWTGQRQTLGGVDGE